MRKALKRQCAVSLTVAGMALSSVLAPAIAQETDEIAPTAEECATVLEEEQNENEDADLADLLARCNGVLTPDEPGMDTDMVITPPDTGTTPVIPPRDVVPGEGSDK